MKTLGDRVDDHADVIPRDVHDQHAAVGRRLGDRQAEALAEIDDGDHPSAEVDHALHELLRVGHERDGLHADDLAHRADVDAVHLVRQVEDHQLPLRVVCHVRSLRHDSPRPR